MLDVISSSLIIHPPSDLSGFVDCYNSTLAALLNKHAPLKSTTLRTKPANKWFTPALNKLKQAKRHLERVWSRSHSTEDLKSFHSATNHYHAAIIKAKRNYNSSLISSSRTNPRQLWKTVNKLLHRTSAPTLPSSNSLSNLAQSFATFFSDKIHKLHTTLLSNRIPVFHLIFHLLISYLSLLSLLMKFRSYYLSLLTRTVTWILFLLLSSNNNPQFLSPL